MTIEALTIEEVRTALVLDEANLGGDEAQIRKQEAMLFNILTVAQKLADKQAPNAPQEVADEAMLRFIGYLYEIGSNPNIDHASIWARCGAKGLLNPWTVRNAGVIE